MAKYLVKETSTATPNNPNYAGEVIVYYFGKGEKMLAREGNHRTYDNFNHIEWCIDEYGYNRPSDAKRAYAYRHPENSRYWTSTVEIVEVEEAPHIKLTGHNFVY